MLCTVTTTVGLPWGSGIMVPKYGFPLNDSMDDFSIEGKPNGFGYDPTPANFGKLHPADTVFPSPAVAVLILLSERWEKTSEFELPVFSRKGWKTDPVRRCRWWECYHLSEHPSSKECPRKLSTSSIYSFVTWLIDQDYGMSAHEAVSANRIHDQIKPIKTCLERASPPQVQGHTEAQAKALEDRGHTVEWLDSRSQQALADDPKLTWYRGYQYGVRRQVHLRRRRQGGLGYSRRTEEAHGGRANVPGKGISSIA